MLLALGARDGSLTLYPPLETPGGLIGASADEQHNLNARCGPIRQRDRYRISKSMKSVLWEFQLKPTQRIAY
jgi:hypothetical protein